MPEDLQSILTSSAGVSAGAQTGPKGTVGASTQTTPAAQSTPVLDALVERLTRQGQGISTSASSNLQNSINQAIADTQKSGDLSRQALQSERGREIAYARDRAGSTYTTALEGRSGYATQVAGLRELTETTEKSIRDLDKRYQEAILTNDSLTAQRVADMRMKKEEFLMEQEQNFYTNMFAVANLQDSAINRLQQSEQFWATQEQSEKQFAMNMAQSSYQFEKNMGISLQEIDLKKQSLQLEAERNQISRAELNAKLAELNKEKGDTVFKASIYSTLRNEIQTKGLNIGSVNAVDKAAELSQEFMAKGYEVDPTEILNYVAEAKAQLVTEGVAPFNQANFTTPYTSPTRSYNSDNIFRVNTRGVQPTIS